MASFSTLIAPTATASAANQITLTSARFHGTVNARNYEAMVVFQYGADGNTFPNQIAATPPTVTGSTNLAVNASVAGSAKWHHLFLPDRGNERGRHDRKWCE